MNANSAKSDNISGLILLASYPSEKVNLSKRHLKVLSITASNDKVLKWDQYKSAKKRLPSDTSYTSISGGNHSEFGDYGHQSKDGDATISQKSRKTNCSCRIKLYKLKQLLKSEVVFLY